MADVIVAFQGWNSSTQGWGEGAWGENIAVPGAVTAVGSVTVTADANVSVTGLSATSSTNDVSVTADANVSVTGLSAT